MHQRLNEVFQQFCSFLNNFGQSRILQQYCMREFEALIYGNLVINFFSKLTLKKVKELRLSNGRIYKIKIKYKDIRSRANKSIKLMFKGNKLDGKEYIDFKKRVKHDFPGFEKLFLEVEKELGFQNLKQDIKGKRQEIKKFGKPMSGFNTALATKLLEKYYKKTGDLIIGKKFDRLLNKTLKNMIPAISKVAIKNLKKDEKELLSYQRLEYVSFKERLYQRWARSLDLLELLLVISTEAGEMHKNKLFSEANSENEYKYQAMVKIHARALRIGNEILELLKSGYPDGANARWRSLYELCVTACFLSEHGNDLSKRYLGHNMVKVYKEAEDYQRYCKILGYKRFSKREFDSLRRQANAVCNQYDDMGKGDYDWIPKTILKDRKFRTLSEHVRFDHLKPFYNLACGSVHAGPRGFYTLGLMDDYQHKILLTGASNYGLADPLQNTTMSLVYINLCLLSLSSNIESITAMSVMNYFIDNCGPSAVKTQKDIEKEEFSRRSKDKGEIKVTDTIQGLSRE